MYSYAVVTAESGESLDAARLVLESNMRKAVEAVGEPCRVENVQTSVACSSGKDHNGNLTDTYCIVATVKIYKFEENN